MKFGSLTLGLLVLSTSAAWCLAEDAPAAPELPILRDRPVATSQTPEEPNLLGPRFESKAAGIALRGPLGSKEFRRGGVDSIVEYLNEERGWVLTVSKVSLRNPRPLRDSDTKELKRIGLLTATVDEFKQVHADADILRQEVINNADGEIGVFALRYFQGANRKLLQQAMIPASEQLYYVVTLLSPAGKDKGLLDDGAKGDAGEAEAANVFRQVLDSVKLLDRGSIRKDQETRLLHTRDLIEALRNPDVMKKAMIPEQYFRVVRDGKDIGYTAVFEQAGERDAHQGILITIRASTAPEAMSSALISSEMFVSFDWRNESWNHLATMRGDKKREQRSELGVTNISTRHTVEENGTTRPTIREVDDYSLEVRTATKRTFEGKPTQTLSGAPLKRKLPPWYLPQAVQQMLPRLVPLDKPQTYMFAPYISDRREVMSQYVNVDRPDEVAWMGRKMKVIPVYSRLGLEGTTTIHYLSPEGQYLGSTATYTGETPSQTTTVQMIPADQAAIKQLWPDANLSKPTVADFRDNDLLKDGK